MSQNYPQGLGAQRAQSMVHDPDEIPCSRLIFWSFVAAFGCLLASWLHAL